MSIYRGIFVMYLICKLYHCAAQSKCRSRKGDEIVCCSGYQFDVKSKECKGCAAGYFGINCSEQCPYPKYGDRCRHHCDCGIDTCDKTNGCLSISTMGPVLNCSHKYISQEANATLFPSHQQGITSKPQNSTSAYGGIYRRFFTPEIVRSKEQKFFDREMSAITFVLCCVIVIYILIKVLIKTCTVFKRAKQDSINLEQMKHEHYHELDEDMLCKQHNQRLQTPLYNGPADANIVFDDTQHKYFIELTMMSHPQQHVKESHPSPTVDIQTTSVVGLRSDSSSVNDYLSPRTITLNQESFTSDSANPQLHDIRSNEHVADYPMEGPYLTVLRD